MNSVVEKRKVNLKKMQLPSHHIIEKILEHANEIDFKRYEPIRIEIWWYPELGVATKPEITLCGSLHSEADIKEIPVGDAQNIEKISAKQSTPNPDFPSREEEKPNTQSPEMSKLVNNLSNLTDKQRFALLLYYMKLTNRKAADIMRIDTSTYRQHLKYAFKKLGSNNQIPPKI